MFNVQHIAEHTATPQEPTLFRRDQGGGPVINAQPPGTSHQAAVGIDEGKRSHVPCCGVIPEERVPVDTFLGDEHHIAEVPGMPSACGVWEGLPESTGGIRCGE